MAFETLWLTSDGAGAVVYSAADFRQLISNLFTTGVLSGLAVSEQSAMNVQVAAGSAIVPSASNEGRYLAWETAATTGVTIGAAPATPGQSRNDLVCLFTKDPAASGGTAGRVTVPVVVAGTAATTGSQVDPSVPAFHLALARVTVANGTAAITNAMITDLRSFATLAGDYVDDAQATRVGTDAATASALVRRDASGRAKVVAPSASTDIANKDYVDNTAGTSAATASALMRRDSSGRVSVANGDGSGHAVNRGQLDAIAAAGVAYTDGAVIPSSGGTTGGGTIEYRRLGSGTGALVIVNCDNWDGSTSAVLPVGYRPASDKYFPVMFTTGGSGPGADYGLLSTATGEIFIGSPGLGGIGFSYVFFAA